MRSFWLILAFAALVSPRAEAAPPAAAATEPVQIQIQNPAANEVVRNKVHLAPIAGSAIAQGKGPPDFDVMIAIDISQSTMTASGVDVDRDGVIGIDPRLELLPPGTYPEDMMSTDPGDSVLAAELNAARALLDSLDPRRVRVALLTFGGEVNPRTGERARPDQQDAWLEAAFTHDYDLLRRALVGIQARGARGATNFAAGTRLAIRELAGLPGAVSQARPNARKVLLFLTDGVPTFPIGRGSVSDPGDSEAAINAARLAHQAGIQINSYAIGPGALHYPLALTEMARVTLGTYTPVQNPGDIIVLLQGVSFANIEDVVFTNLTTGDFSTDVRLSPDGTFNGFVPVQEGSNRVRVTALSSDGTRASVEMDLEFKMSELSDRELALELERMRKRNKELQILVERRRIEAFREREKQRRELELSPDPAPNGKSTEEATEE